MICDPLKCTGCGLCKNVCPQDCIDLQTDKDGFITYNIDEALCIHCDKCKRLCPQNNVLTKDNFEEPLSYCCQTLDEKDLHLSSSGGMFSAIAKYVIEEHNGVVYASKMNEKLLVGFNRFENVKDLRAAQGSKYVQSFVQNTYRNVQEDLNAGRYVMFIGCPCQVYALKAFLAKDYDNLILVDLVCHGVGPYSLYFQNLSRHNKKNKEIVDVRFRSKDKFTFTNHYIMKLTFRDGKKKYVSALNDWYMAAYFRKAIYRESCYHCRFTGFPRVGDITVGDFAGVSIAAVGKKRYEKGVSVLLVNNHRGKNLFEAIQKRIWYIQRPLSEATSTNLNLLYPCDRPSLRNMLDDGNLSETQKLEAMRYSVKNKIGICMLPYINRIKQKIKELRKTKEK